MEFARLFTPEEARKTLPLVRRIVADILATARELREREPSAEGHAEAISRMNEYHGELEAVGCYYKDWSYTVGLVDFPAVVDGETVFLCWRSDEGELSWYHGIEEGYRGRRRLAAARAEEA